MINFEEFIKVIDYKITGGSEFLWKCFGPNSRYMDSEAEHYSASIIFDADTQVVYQATITDRVNDRPYRMTHPDYLKKYKQETKDRGIDYDEAWDDVSWIDLENKQDWLEKARAIINKQEYDTRIVIPLDLPEDEVFRLMKIAHERDITFNALMEEFLEDVLKLKDNSLSF